MPAYVRREAPRSPIVSSARVRSLADRMLRALELEHRELSVLLTDDAFIRGLNHSHRGKDGPTDVLAFPLDEGVVEGEPAGPLPAQSGTKRGKKRAAHAGSTSSRRAPRAAPAAADVMLGDVIISLDTAQRQARQRRHSLLDEIRFLLAHGLLHLIGYDHHTDAEEHEMNAMTARLVSATRQREAKAVTGKRAPKTRQHAAKARRGAPLARRGPEKQRRSRRSNSEA
jgi:probable rRNA maturation factor